MGRFDFHGWSPPESFRAGHVVVNEEELPHLTSRGVQDNLPGYDFRIEHIVDTKFRPLFPRRIRSDKTEVQANAKNRAKSN